MSRKPPLSLLPYLITLSITLHHCRDSESPVADAITDRDSIPLHDYINPPFLALMSWLRSDSLHSIDFLSLNSIQF